MTGLTHPFTGERHALGAARDGRALNLDPMTPDAAARLAPAIAAIGPWAHYGFPPETLRAAVLGSGHGAIGYQVLCDGAAAGAIIIRAGWLAGPHLQMLAVLPPWQGCGIGSAILDWYEATAIAARQRNVWLCVTGFNRGAQALYRRHGYELAGLLPGLLRDGDDELLMRKDLSGRLPPTTG